MRCIFKGKSRILRHVGMMEAYMRDDSVSPASQGDICCEGWVRLHAAAEMGAQGFGCPCCPLLVPSEPYSSVWQEGHSGISTISRT